MSQVRRTLRGLHWSSSKWGCAHWALARGGCCAPRRAAFHLTRASGRVGSGGGVSSSNVSMIADSASVNAEVSAIA